MTKQDVLKAYESFLDEIKNMDDYESVKNAAKKINLEWGICYFLGHKSYEFAADFHAFYLSKHWEGFISAPILRCESQKEAITATEIRIGVIKKWIENKDQNKQYGKIN